MKAADFFKPEEKEAIVKAVKEAELNTSGEIRVHLEDSCSNDVLDCAADIFEKLAMHKTQLRNGVLFYLAIKNKQFAILGDAGINAIVPANFWDAVSEEMVNNFRENRFAEGLVKGIQMAGQQLKQHFPYAANDVNELSDEISYGSK
jgi:uncharacterized membrane protein